MLEMDASTTKNTVESLTHFKGGELGGNVGKTVGDTDKCNNVAGEDNDSETGEKVDLISSIIKFNEPKTLNASNGDISTLTNITNQLVSSHQRSTTCSYPSASTERTSPQK
jgi:hypothetical protein